MKNLSIHDLTLDDLVFEHRNHAYGAFAIRKNYDRNMSKATLLAVLFFVSAFLSPGIIESLTQKESLPLIPEEFIVHEFVANPNLEKVIVQPRKENPANRIESGVATIEQPTKVVDDNMDALAIQKNDNPDNTYFENDGLINANNGMNEPTGNSGRTGAGLISDNTGNSASDEEVFLIPDELPVFGDDKSSFNKYLLKNINIPQIARDNRIEGKVIIEFIIDKNGEVKSIQVLRGIGAGCDEEVIRVLKRMPKWKAGKHHGKLVNVKLVLPVAFKYY